MNTVRHHHQALLPLMPEGHYTWKGHVCNNTNTCNFIRLKAYQQSRFSPAVTARPVQCVSVRWGSCGVPVVPTVMLCLHVLAQRVQRPFLKPSTVVVIEAEHRHILIGYILYIYTWKTKIKVGAIIKRVKNIRWAKESTTFPNKQTTLNNSHYYDSRGMGSTLLGISWDQRC